MVSRQREGKTDVSPRTFNLFIYTNSLQIQKGVVALDLAIRHSLLNASEDIKRSQRQADVTEEMASQLDSQLRNSQLISDREVQAKEKQIVYLEKQLRITKYVGLVLGVNFFLIAKKYLVSVTRW